MSESSFDVVLHVLAFQIEDLQLSWTTVYMIVSMSVILMYTVSSAAAPVGKSRSLPLPPPYLARSRQRKAAFAAALELEKSRTRVLSNWSAHGFPQFVRLPVELQLYVLEHATDCYTDIDKDSSADADIESNHCPPLRQRRRTYHSLILVSKHMYYATLRACLPRMHITLSTTKNLASFAALVVPDSGHDKHAKLLSVGALVHHLWLSPLQRDSTSFALTILRVCTNVRSLACDPRTLTHFLTRSSRFRHTRCTRFTLLLSLPAHWWEQPTLLNAPSSILFFQQLTHLRLLSPKMVPPSQTPSFPFTFSKLRHLSYPIPARSYFSSSSANEDEEISLSTQALFSDRTTFPSLTHLVLTRYSGIKDNIQQQRPRKLNPRLVLLPISRDKLEIDVWCDNHNIWSRALGVS